MPCFHELVDLNDLYNSLRLPPLIVNDFNIDSEEDRTALSEKIFTKHSSDTMNVLPMCSCGKTMGEFTLGSVCPYCDTVVKLVVDELIEPVLWFRRPIGVQKLINPSIYIQLNKFFYKNNFSIIQWLTNTSYKPKSKIPPFVDDVIAAGIHRGYNYFVENFDAIMEFLFSHKIFSHKIASKPIKKRNKKKVVEDEDGINNDTSEDDSIPEVDKKTLRDLITRERNIIFSDYIPLPNKVLLILEDNPLGKWMEFNNIPAIDAILNIAGIDSTNVQSRLRTKQNTTAKAIRQLCEYYRGYHKTNIASKHGIFRKNIISSRCHHSFRVVASSITGPLDYKKTLAPWCAGLTAYRHHVLNKLLKRGYTLNSSIGLLYAHTNKYHKVLDEILKELIAESPYDGLPIIFQRNPSLPMGSAQFFLIEAFKSDLDFGKDACRDTTFGVPILCVKAPNLDFDGDQGNITVINDNNMAKLCENLAPHRNVFVLDTPHKVSKNISIPKNVICTMSNWLLSKERYTFTQSQLDAFAAIPEVD